MIACFIALVPLPTSASRSPKYLPAVKQEIARLGFNADCRDAEGICTLTATPENGSDTGYKIAVIIDDASATVRFVVNDFLPKVTLTGNVAKQLLAINHQLVVARLSLDEKSNTITLSALVNTDSNFDRKTFRSVLKGFIQVMSDLNRRFNSETTPKPDAQN